MKRLGRDVVPESIVDIMCDSDGDQAHISWEAEQDRILRKFPDIVDTIMTDKKAEEQERQING